MASSKVAFDSFIFTDNNKEQLEKYQCPKCEYILRDAVQTSCGHWLCQGCAEEIFKKNPKPTCPRLECSEELTDEDGKPFFPDRFIRKEINRFSIICVNRKHGCDWSGVLGQLIDHLSMCVYEKKACPHCKDYMSPAEYTSHVDSCPQAITHCPFKDLACSEKKEIVRDKHLSTPSGIVSHLLLIASYLSNLKSKSRIKTDGNEVEKDCAGSSPHTSTTRGATAKPNFRMIQSDGGYNTDSDMQRILNEMASANMPGLDKLTQYMTTTKHEVDTLRKHLSEKDSIIYTLQDKVQYLESTIQTKSSEYEDRDFRLSLMENSNYDGTMVWKIPPFSHQFNMWVQEGNPSATKHDSLGSHTSYQTYPLYEANCLGLDEFATSSRLETYSAMREQCLYLRYGERDKALKLMMEKDSLTQQQIKFLCNLLNKTSNHVENRDLDGVFFWLIPNVYKKLETVKSGQRCEVTSPSFYSCFLGYNFSVRLFFTYEDETDYLAAAVSIVKGEFDILCPLPCNVPVSLTVINQCGGHDIFQANPLISSFQEPNSDMNVASGCPRFVSLNELMQGGFIVEDTVFIKVKVDVTTMKHP